MISKERVKIIGPPGTGKTTSLIEVVQKELDRGLQSNEILFASFTRAAAHEARWRAMLKFGGEAGDYPYFGTEHSICFRLLGLEREQVFNRKQLKEFGEEHNYDFSSSQDVSLDTRFQESMLNTQGDYFEFFIHYMRESMLPFSEAYNKLIRNNELECDFNYNRLKIYLERRNEYKQKNRLWDFSDMIQGVIEGGLFPQEVKVVILDEMQDSSRLLWELANMWAERAERVYIAGDPLQTLYFWSGARPELFYDFTAEEHTLSKSYRLPVEIKDYAQRIIQQTNYPFPIFSSSGREGEVGLGRFSQVDWWNTKDAFLLARTRYIITQIADYFITKGIPFSSERGRPSPLATKKGDAFNTLLKIKEDEPIDKDELVNLVKYTKRPYLEYGAKAAISRLEERPFKGFELGDLGFTDYFFEVLSSEDFAFILSTGLGKNEVTYMQKLYRHYGREVFAKQPPIIITTIHGSKGRERDNVFVLPDMTRRVHESFIRDKDHEALVYYVACTRAKNSLTILRPFSIYSYPLPRIVIEGGINNV